MPRDEVLKGKRKYTAKAFEDAYIELVETAPKKHISVQMLCDYTELNRTTFYRYYQDINDLEISIVEGFFSKIFAPLGSLSFHTPAASNSKEMILQQLKISLKNRKLAKLIITEDRLPVVKQLMERHMTIFLDAVNGSTAPKKMVSILYSYFCGGMASVWVSWIQEDFDKDLDDLADLILCLISDFYRMVNERYGSDMDNDLVAEMVKNQVIS